MRRHPRVSLIVLAIIIFVGTLSLQSVIGAGRKSGNRARSVGVMPVTPKLEAARVTLAAPPRVHEDAPVGDLVSIAPTETGALGSAPPPVASSARSSQWTQPIETVWPAVNEWNDRMEREYTEFVAAIGAGIRERRCTRLESCLRDPSINVLYDASTDGRSGLTAPDCADLPYILRAYFAMKRRLPFGFVSGIRGNNSGDVRYMADVQPVAWRSWREYPTPRRALDRMGELVNSGMYRLAPDIENGDFYAVAVTRRAIRPGTVYYDPNGHVLVVAQVRDDGVVYLIDGHPDGSITWKRFGEAFAIGSARYGGGFKNFRPVFVDADSLRRASSTSLPDFDAHSQWDSALRVVDGRASTYHEWIRSSLALANAVRDPVQDFREEVQALCRDVTDRVDAVNTAVSQNFPTRAHPDALPWNIYGTDGDWEIYSTPSRDARLKAAMREVRDLAASIAGDPARLAQLREIWRTETASADCRFAYTNSVGARVELALDDVLSRVFSLSFDPYHCPEHRWGAPEGSAELASCPDDGQRLAWYRAEQRLRNRIDREYGIGTPLDYGPSESPDVDVRRVLGLQ